MNYSAIKQYDIANGEGIRTSLFVSGCNFHCPNCFNQESQSFTYGEPFTEDTLLTITNYLNSSLVTGLSLLGGDPLWQDSSGISQLITICKEAHRLAKTVWLWSGFTWEEIFPEVTTNEFVTNRILRQELVKNVDVFIDGRFEDDKRDLRLQWRGSSNQRVIDVQKSIESNTIILYDN